MPSSFEAYVQLFETEALGTVFESFGEQSSDGETRAWQVCVNVVEPSAQSLHVSFVNSISTLRGGTHVDYLLDVLSKKIAAVLSKDPSMPHVPPSFIRSHLLLFVNCLLENPSFDSQTKETLTTKLESIKKSCTVPNALVDRVVFLFLFRHRLIAVLC